MNFLATCILAFLIGGNAMKTDHIHWLGHASFRIEDDTLQIYIDPWKLGKEAPKADVILITHAHYDHFSVEDIEKIRKPTTLFVAPKDVAAQIKGTVTAVEPSKEYTIGTLKVTTVPAYNPTKKFHPQANHWVGYIITLSSGQRIYHAGDTDVTPEMKTVVTDVALLPCGGTYTMTATEAAEAANIFQPKVLIPMHWGDIVGAKNDAETIQRLFKGTTVIKTVER